MVREKIIAIKRELEQSGSSFYKFYVNLGLGPTAKFSITTTTKVPLLVCAIIIGECKATKKKGTTKLICIVSDGF